MTYLPEYDFFVHEVNLPRSVRGAVTPHPDNTFSIYINSNLSLEQKKETLKHEVAHILEDDFYSNKPITEIEGNKKSRLKAADW